MNYQSGFNFIHQLSKTEFTLMTNHNGTKFMLLADIGGNENYINKLSYEYN